MKSPMAMAVRVVDISGAGGIGRATVGGVGPS